MDEQLTKKQRYELKQQRKQETKTLQQKEDTKHKTYLSLAVLIPAVIIAGLIGYTFYNSNSGNGENTSPLTVSEVFDDQGRQHIDVDAQHPPYNSNPPTSGWHYASPADWGVYAEELAQEQLIHNLEHGGIVIQYKPSSTTPEIVAQLEELKRSEFECKLVVAPYSNMDTSIALTSWRRLYTADTYKEEEVKDFITSYEGTGPETVPCNTSVDHS
jgi:hypothetical protein